MRKRSKRTVRRIVAPTIVAYCLNPEVTIQERSAVLALRGGWAEGSHYNLLANVRDLLMLAASEKHDKAVIGVCDLAGVALLNIKDRYTEKNRFGATGEQQLKNALCYQTLRCPRCNHEFPHHWTGCGSIRVMG